jgi:putative FmdB family regulatory protein
LPLYEYQCANDGRFEQMRKFSDPPLTVCPKCGGPIEKLLSAPAIQFKGSGWYITDYARKSGADSGKDGKASAAAGADGSSTSKEASGASTSSSSASGTTGSGGASSDRK